MMKRSMIEMLQRNSLVETHIAVVVHHSHILLMVVGKS